MVCVFRPDITVMVDWALKVSIWSVYNFWLDIEFTCLVFFFSFLFFFSSVFFRLLFIYFHCFCFWFWFFNYSFFLARRGPEGNPCYSRLTRVINHGEIISPEEPKNVHLLITLIHLSSLLDARAALLLPWWWLTSRSACTWSLLNKSTTVFIITQKQNNSNNQGYLKTGFIQFHWP